MTEQDWVSGPSEPADAQRMLGIRHVARLLSRAIVFAVLTTSGCGLFNSHAHDWSASFDGQAGQAHQLPDGGYVQAG
jgi:hypothetical protein